MKPIHSTLVALLATYSISLASGARADELIPPASPVPATKSEGKAFTLSLLSTAVPIAAGIIGSSSNARGADDGPWGALVAGGYLLGPSVGHIYAGRGGRAAAGIGIRTLAVVGLGAAIAATWDNESTAGNAAAIGALALGGASALVDIWGAPGSARAANARAQKNHLSVAPAVVGQAHAPGVCVALTY